MFMKTPLLIIAFSLLGTIAYSQQIDTSMRIGAVKLAHPFRYSNDPKLNDTATHIGATIDRDNMKSFSSIQWFYLTKDGKRLNCNDYYFTIKDSAYLNWSGANLEAIKMIATAEHIQLEK